MSYFLAPSLVQLRNEVNAAHPNRDKSSDGWVGDPAHAARKSDHNPDYAAGGIVRALDIDHDGIDRAKLLKIAIANPTTEYVIQDGYIYSRAYNFAKRVYTGPNKHDKHSHISIRHTVGAAAATAWGYFTGVSSPAPKPAPTSPPPGRASVTEVAQQVIAGKWGNDPDRTTRLRGSGYDPNAVQAEVNRILKTGAPTPRPSKTNEQLAREVIAGQWGNGPDRSRRLSAAGFSPTKVQTEVNRILSGARPAPARLSIGVLAQQVIAGQWGNSPERERRITAAGYDYQAVRAEVNRRVS